MKKVITTFAAAGLLGFAACAGEDEPVIIEEPVIEQPAPAPTISEPMPMTTDTSFMDTDTMMDTPGAVTPTDTM